MSLPYDMPEIEIFELEPDVWRVRFVGATDGKIFHLFGIPIGGTKADAIYEAERAASKWEFRYVGVAGEHS